ncbi:MAG TPA: hypothetical protein GX697_05050, partial [Firmicutes bacterium]|nr:hypothetical protein [Bacillota bacterium]
MANRHNYEEFGPSYRQLISDIEKEIKPIHEAVSVTAEKNQLKVLDAFRGWNVGEDDFASSTGYGYNEAGREKTEAIYAAIFGGEKALVRPQLVSGTHAITCCLYGILRPGDSFLSVTGTPYESIRPAMGLYSVEEQGSLADFKITYLEIDLITETKARDAAGTIKKIKDYKGNKAIKMVYVQRSRGYSLRPALTIDDLEFLTKQIKTVLPETVIFVDNCYGEFVETREPLEAGADLIAGSLIKNPGGGISPGGGYIVGKAALVDKAAARLTAPGLGAALGPTYGLNRYILQGLFLAPHFVAEALKAASFAALLFKKSGFNVYPDYSEYRGDIVQAVELKTPERITGFCEEIQKYSPVDSFLTPVPAPMPGYKNNIIMAGGTFVQGASLELSADAPLIPPYVVYLQGGL